jgi:integrase
VLDTHKRISAKLKIPVTTLHDWRHTYAVNSLRDGMKPTTVARQLGHRDASLVHRVYGRFIVDARDYATDFTTISAVGRKGKK